MDDVISFGDLKFYRVGGGWVPVYDGEMRDRLHDWCGIEPADFATTTTSEEDDDDDDNA